MVTSTLCVEGGGRKALNRECRKGFREFLTSAGVGQTSVQVEACGSRGNAYKAFTADFAKGFRVLLLVDAERAVTAPSPWQHLQANDNWTQPADVADDQCHLMVEVMEAWFLTDPEALQSFYGQGFRKQVLPRDQNVEQVEKRRVLEGLERATQDTGRGRYSKGKHSFELLAKLDPAKVRHASPFADRLIRTLQGSS